MPARLTDFQLYRDAGSPLNPFRPIIDPNATAGPGACPADLDDVGGTYTLTLTCAAGGQRGAGPGRQAPVRSQLQLRRLGARNWLGPSSRYFSHPASHPAPPAPSGAALTCWARRPTRCPWARRTRWRGRKHICSSFGSTTRPTTLSCQRCGPPVGGKAARQLSGPAMACPAGPAAACADAAHTRRRLQMDLVLPNGTIPLPLCEPGEFNLSKVGGTLTK